jgi:hypothetical protein
MHQSSHIFPMLLFYSYYIDFINQDYIELQIFILLDVNVRFKMLNCKFSMLN